MNAVFNPCLYTHRITSHGAFFLFKNGVGFISEPLSEAVKPDRPAGRLISMARFKQRKAKADRR